VRSTLELTIKNSFAMNDICLFASEHHFCVFYVAKGQLTEDCKRQLLLSTNEYGNQLIHFSILNYTLLLYSPSSCVD
jgi:hypothetical protein